MRSRRTPACLSGPRRVREFSLWIKCSSRVPHPNVALFATLGWDSTAPSLLGCCLPPGTWSMCGADTPVRVPTPRRCLTHSPLLRGRELRPHGQRGLSEKDRVGSIATHPCKERKDGAPSVGIAQANSRAGHPPLLI